MAPRTRTGKGAPGGPLVVGLAACHAAPSPRRHAALNLRQLRYFVEAAEAGSMARAADRLRIAQPALGMQIRALEEERGVALLDRHSRGIAPTEAGRLLMQRARAILDLVEAARRDVMAPRGDADETIRLGLTPSLMHMVAPEIVLLARERAPRLVLSLAEDMSHLLADALERGDLDAALAYELPEIPGVARRGLYQEDLALVTLPRPGQGTPVAFAEALAQPLVLPEARDSVRSLVEGTARELGLTPRLAYEVRSIPGIKNMILRGGVAGILPFGTVAQEVAEGRLDARPVVAPALRRTLYLAFTGPQGRLRHEAVLTEVVHAALVVLAKALGPFAHPLLPPAGAAPAQGIA